MYSSSQKAAVSNYLKRKYKNRDITELDTVLTLVVLVKLGRIKEDDVKDILFNVFCSPKKVLEVLISICENVDDDVIERIMKDLSDVF